MRLTIVIALVSAFCCGTALAGPAYTPPKVGAAKTVEASDDLRAAATELLKAVAAKDVEDIGRWLAPKLTVVNGAIDLAYPRNSKLEGPWESAASQVADLGNSTGGDWDVPVGVDVEKFLTGMELSFISQSLTDGQPWGTNAAVKGATCTYAVGSYDPAAVKRAAKKLGIEGSSFVAVKLEIELLDVVKGGKAVGTLAPGLLYGIDYDSETPSGWTAFHLANGGIGFAKVDGDDLDRPYASGLCFKKQASGEWAVVAQAATGL
jgi:hypothetical protein